MKYRDGPEGVKDHIYDSMLRALKKFRDLQVKFVPDREMTDILDEFIEIADEYRAIGTR